MLAPIVAQHAREETGTGKNAAESIMRTAESMSARLYVVADVR